MQHFCDLMDNKILLLFQSNWLRCFDNTILIYCFAFKCECLFCEFDKSDNLITEARNRNINYLWENVHLLGNRWESICKSQSYINGQRLWCSKFLFLSRGACQDWFCCAERAFRQVTYSVLFLTEFRRKELWRKKGRLFSDDCLLILGRSSSLMSKLSNPDYKLHGLNIVRLLY